MSTAPLISAGALERYLLRRREDLAVLSHAVENENWEEILFIAHKIKGNGATFGFEKLSQLAGLLEKHARRQNKKEVMNSLDHLKSWFTKIAGNSLAPRPFLQSPHP